MKKGPLSLLLLTSCFTLNAQSSTQANLLAGVWAFLDTELLLAETDNREIAKNIQEELDNLSQINKERELELVIGIDGNYSDGMEQGTYQLADNRIDFHLDSDTITFSYQLHADTLELEIATPFYYNDNEVHYNLVTDGHDAESKKIKTCVRYSFKRRQDAFVSN